MDQVAPAHSPRMSRSWNVVVWVLFCCGCASKSQETPDSGVGTGPAPVASGGSLATAPLQPAATQVFPTAQAVLQPYGDSNDPVSGSATWNSTPKGVDLSVKVLGCSAGMSNPLEVLDAADCSAQTLKAAQPWAEGRGKSIPSVHCVAGGVRQASMAYSRASSRADAWSVGDGGAKDVVGRVLVARDAAGAVRACGRIERAADVVRVPVPPRDQAPSIESRAAVSGICLARQFPNTNESCPNAASVVGCVEQHCDLGGCLQACGDYTRCLDTTKDVCSISADCVPSAECVTCQSALSTCLLGFCAEHATCAPGITPDGPCAELSFCCALQGDQASACISVLSPVISSLGGDANCIGSMNDWDVLSHMHVPCTFAAPGQAPPSLPTAGVQANASMGPALADGAVGRACAADAECPGGYCERLPAATSGHCTRVCNTEDQCGAGGRCIALGLQSTDKRCLASCTEQAECRDGFICSGGLAGTGIALSASCRPKRQVKHLADDSAGRACSADNECGGGACASTNLLGGAYPGNYCTGRCYADSECGRGGVCLWPRNGTDPGYCLKQCKADAECGREGYGCWKLGDGERVIQACYPRAKALPDHTAGRPCTQDAQCGGNVASCASQLPSDFVTNELMPALGGYCSQRCALDSECGAGAQCVNYGTSGGMCFASCSDAAPCRTGYMCIDHQRDHDSNARVCVARDPNLTGADAGM